MMLFSLSISNVHDFQSLVFVYCFDDHFVSFYSFFFSFGHCIVCGLLHGFRGWTASCTLLILRLNSIMNVNWGWTASWTLLILRLNSGRVCSSRSISATRFNTVENPMISHKRGTRTELWLWENRHIRVHPSHRYFVPVDQVMIVTVRLQFNHYASLVQ
jgi:hypothetical protein